MLNYTLKGIRMGSGSIELLKALSDSSKQMLGNLSKKVVIEEVLAILGKVADVDRTYVFQNNFENDKPISFSYAFEWCAEGIEPHVDNPELHNVPWERFADLKLILDSRESFSANTIDLEDDPSFKQALEMQGIKSVLFMPIFTDYEFWGYIGFDDCKQARAWSEVEMLTLSSIAANLGAFIQRKGMRRQINQQHALIEEQRTFYERLINKIPADVVVIGTDYKYKFVSEHAVVNPEIRSWLIDKTDHDYVEYRNKDKALADKRLVQIKNVLTTRQRQSHEETFLMPDGSVKHHIRVLHPVINPDDHIDYIVGYGIDITALKERDAIVLKQHNVIEETPIGVAFLDAEGKYYYMNKSHETLFDYEPGELIGKSWHTIYLQDEIDKINNLYFPELIKNGKWSGETLGIKKDGTPIWQEITLTLSEDGGLVCMVQDITKTKEKLKVVEQMHEQLELAMDASELAMVTWDLQGKVVKFSESIRRIMPNWSSSILEMPITAFLSYIFPEDLKNVEQLLGEIASKKRDTITDAFSMEFRVRTKGMEYISLFAKGKVSQFDEDGLPSELNGFILDVSKQRELDTQVKVSEKRYRDLVESIKEVMFKIDLTNRWKFVNKAWTEITGFTQEETIGKRITDFIPEEDYHKYMHWYRELSKNPALKVNDEIRFIDKKGNVLLIDFSASALIDQIDNTFEIVGVAQNITQIKAIEAELEQSKQLLEQIVSSIDEVIWSFDISEDRLTYISPSCEHLTNHKDVVFYENANIWYDLVDRHYVEQLNKSDLALHNGEKKSRDIIYPINVNNQIKWLRDQAKVVFDDGKPSRIDGVSTDITELIEAEQKLKLSEEKYRLISESIQDIISVLDIDGNITYISPSSVKITGYKYDDLLHNNFLKVIHPEDVKRVFRFLRDTVNRKESDSILFRFVKANGDVIWMETVVSLFQTTAEGKVLIQASSRDVTARKQAEIELTKALAKEKELGELKSRFVSMASHEFRTPLSTIRVGAELIKMFIDKDTNKLSPKTEHKVSDKVNEILIDVDRISDLMTDILTMGKVEASRVPFNPSIVSMVEFIEEYLHFEAPRIFHARKYNYVNEALNAQINIDRKLMKQVLQNALSNAVKYSPANSVVDITIKEEKGKVSIVVSDHGIGIPEKDLPFVFESFFRAANAENIPGTGLGMPIIRLFTEMNRGEVALESVQNKGTSLIITLPMV